MQRTTAFIFLFLLSVTLGAAPGQTTIDTTLNVITGCQFLSGSMSKLASMRKSPEKKFVVVHFGDSHIQGDNFSGEIRRNLQSAFGEGGEGVLFPYSLCKSFGPASLLSTSTGAWTWATVLKNPDKVNVGVTGYTLISKDSSATLSFTIVTISAVSPGGDIAVWYGGANSSLLLGSAAPGLKLECDTANYGTDLHRAVIHNYLPGTKITFRFKKANRKSDFDFHFYGLSLGTDSGVEYNRCGVVGATFLQLISQEEFTIQHLKALKPDLLFFSYGSNESYNTGLDMKLYASQISYFIVRLQREFPGINIVITSPPDTRSANRFPVNTQPIVDSLRAICQRTQCAFWDLHGIMGGNESIYFWLNNSLARKDKLHFTKAGYELQGDLFSKAFLNAYQQQNSGEEIPMLKMISDRIATQLSSLAVNGSQQPVAAVSGNDHEHIVKKGETLSIIARDNKVTVAQLCEWNNIRKTDVLKVGQKIVIKK
jgi:LysM repeat protein